MYYIIKNSRILEEAFDFDYACKVAEHYARQYGGESIYVTHEDKVVAHYYYPSREAEILLEIDAKKRINGTLDDVNRFADGYLQYLESLHHIACVDGDFGKSQELLNTHNDVIDFYDAMHDYLSEREVNNGIEEIFENISSFSDDYFIQIMHNLKDARINNDLREATERWNEYVHVRNFYDSMIEYLDRKWRA